MLVTGGSGFVGRALVRQLDAAGYRVRVLSRFPAALPGRETVRGDVTDAGSLGTAVRGVHAVAHLAGVARARGHTGAVDAVNAAGTANLLAALADSAGTGPVAFVLASSSAVYGGAVGRLRETAALDPANAYGASKAAAEEHLRRAVEAGSVTGAALRCFNVAGAVGRADPDTTRIVNRAIAVARGRVKELTLNGDGHARRDYVHVHDVATAYRLAIDHLLATPQSPCSAYNIGTGHGVSLLEVVQAVRAVSGRGVPVAPGPAAAEAAELVADPTRAWRELDWEAQRSGIGRIVADAWRATQRR